MKYIDINNLYKSFGDFVALENLNLTIEKGEIFGLLGPNGAGKSTAINILTNILDKDRGSIKVLNKELKRNDRNIKGKMGLVPQDLAIFEDMTSLENVMFFASLYGLKGRELKENSLKALEFVGLENTKKLSKTFSGGMKRRLNIACAIAHNPEILILDEPTVGIDPQSRNHIMKSIQTLNKNGCTIIYTTHYMEEVETLCNNIVIIDKGKVIANGDKNSLKAIISDKNKFEVLVDDVTYINKNELLEIVGVDSIEFKENKIYVSLDRELSSLNEFILYLSSKNIKILDIKSKIVTLEDVFLNLTGRTLRD
ncbi:ABC transporter ATP-binding protein [Romboutsia sedimentorum]|uniref:ABC transporter ATP-binding protein n=1 Tax=Romboutsia sedimentorum TaxID=1368474 RepID=A0ABT7EFH9_9FIRM|nr:ABC transporter ATP-binding protein [Romboutsia sedimentorum]MDK2564666.1 ABC transporter ATP-binding protein [Romboutsia sedimentorum]MDK2586373.1 ABC transporter ATP-binding protein [Romboutsia sedimentorum]